MSLDAGECRAQRIGSVDEHTQAHRPVAPRRVGLQQLDADQHGANPKHAKDIARGRTVLGIDAEAPVLAGANAKYRRLAMALDTGAAIRGEVRADLYIGRGDRAGLEAGRVRHTLRMMRLVPVESSAKNGSDETDFARR